MQMQQLVVNKITNPTWLRGSGSYEEGVAKPTTSGAICTLYATPIPPNPNLWRRKKESRQKAEKGDHCRCAGCPVRFLPELIVPPIFFSLYRRRKATRIGESAIRGGRGAGGKATAARGVSPWRRGRGGHGGGSVTCPRPGRPHGTHAVPSCLSSTTPPCRPAAFRAMSTRNASRPTRPVADILRSVSRMRGGIMAEIELNFLKVCLDWGWKFFDVTSNVSEGCREGFLQTNKKTNYITRQKTARQIY